MVERLPASLILTVLNEEVSLPSFLASVGRMDEIPDEIVVVDGGSSDSTLEVIERAKERMECTVSVIQIPGCGIAEGRNVAIANARHDRILVSDGGTELSSNWAKDLANALEECDVASGFFIPRLKPIGFSAFLGRIITPRLEEISPEDFLPSSRSLGIRRSAWKQAGGYPEWLDYCEDLLFDLRLKQDGCRFEFVPSAVASWDARPDVSSFAKQYYRYARGDGKAQLWPRRHALRYASYALGTMLIWLSITSSPIMLVPLGLGFLAYASKYARRVASSRHTLGIQGTAVSMALIVPILTIGDVSKMLGYPVGLSWRWRNRAARTHKEDQSVA